MLGEKTVYFDNAATTFPKPEVVYSCMDAVNRNLAVNAGRGSYALAREATSIIDEARLNLGKLINVKNTKDVIFAPSATIALNQIILGLEWNEYQNIYVSPFEHNAVMRPLHYIQAKFGINIIEIPFNKGTLELELDNMKAMFASKQPDYVFLSHISNTTGYILPVERIIAESKKYSAVVILDCAQSMGLLPIDIQEMNADFLVYAGHKTLYAPFGIGGFIKNSNVVLNKVLNGGTGSDSLNLDMPDTSPMAFEAASPNVVAVAGLNAALKWQRGLSHNEVLSVEKKLSDYLIQQLNEIKGIKQYLPKDLQRHIGTVSFNLNGYNADDLGAILDQDFNIAVRTGYHCAPFIHELLETKDKKGTVRVSMSFFNTKQEIDYLVNALKEI